MNFVEMTRQQGGRIRVRSDAITAITEASLGKENVPGLLIQLGPNLSVATTGDTMESLFNKLTQAFNGKRPVVVTSPSVEVLGQVIQEISE